MEHIIAQDIEELVRRPNLDVSKLKNTAILVAGGNSLLGKYIVWLICHLNRFEDFNITLYVLVRNLKKAQVIFGEWADQDYFHFIHQDICDPIDSVLIDEEKGIDYIFHFAGSASARFITEDPTGIIRANTLGTMRLLDIARRMRAKNIAFASTREIYGKLPDDITYIKETDVGALDTLHPRNSYPESKRMAEALLVAYEKQFGVPHTILRIAHTYGPGMEIENDGRVMADFIGAVARKEDIVLNSDGHARRSFCYITDCIDGILRATLTECEYRVFNLANETEPYMVREVAQMAVDSFPELGLKVTFSNETEGAFKGGYNPLPLIQLDTGRIESLGWKPHISLEEGIKRTILSFW
ncbi:MAG: NAD-dependent epimerase/dehydratase family protein [Coriobacteriia bacterium]|nr:NAD-dependent epimerase/dehydratase family protein [Coriobacteriia bacterium]